jgi:DNA-binding transcriptional LysR family regulator
MNASIRQLRDFVAVASASSFTRAALESHIAQPALTHQIRRLENELGVTVFVRGPRGVTLTADGEELLAQAKTVLGEYDSLRELAGRLRRRAVGSLRIGFLAQGPGELLYEALRAFSVERPTIQVALQPFGFEDCFMGITRGLTDVGFSMGALDEHEEVAAAPLFQESMVVAMATDHPLAGRNRLHISEVLSQPLFTDVHPPGRYRDYWDAMAYREGRAPTVINRAATHDEWLEALRLCHGVSFCPQSTPAYYPRPGLVYIPLDGVEPVIHWVLWRKGATSRHVGEFIETVAAAAARRGRAPCRASLPASGQVTRFPSSPGQNGHRAYVSPQVWSSRRTGSTALPASVRRYSSRGGCSL